MAQAVGRQELDIDPLGWFGSACVSVISGFVGWHFWPKGLTGDDVAAGVAAFAWCLAVSQGLKAWRTWDTVSVLKKVRRNATKPVSEGPSARFASTKDLKKKGLFKGKGVFVGVDPGSGREISYDGVSTLCVAGPGAGKSTSSAAQILLRPTRESAFVVDPKMELYHVTAKARRAMGHEVVCINPFVDDFNAQFPHAEQAMDAGFNPFGFITEQNTLDDIRLVCNLIIPERNGADSSDDYFLSFGREILTGFALLIWKREGVVTLVGLRALLLADQSTFEEALAEMSESEDFNGEMARFGNRIGGTYLDSKKEWSGAIGAATDALQPFHADGALAESTSKPGVDFSRMKDSKKPMTVYFCVPAERIPTLRGYMALVVSLAIELIARDKSHGKVTLLIDELQNISRMSTLLKGLALYRGAGIRVVMLVQFLSALQRLYGESYREFLGADCVTLFGASSDPTTLEIFSKLSGEAAFVQRSVSSDPSRLTVDQAGFTASVNQGRRPLISVGELRTLGDKEQISLISNLPPLKSHRQSYLENPTLRSRASHNPYYRRPGIVSRIRRLFR